MVYYVEGILKEKKPSWIVVDVHGVGYEINIPFSIFEHLPALEEKVKIYTYLEFKENKMAFYGFLNPDDREFFLNLISISKIGPRSALRMFTRVSPSQLKKIITEGNLSELMNMPGIGRKTAQRLILELRESLERKPAFIEKEGLAEDGVAALISLGYTKTEAQKAIAKVLHEKKETVNDLTNLIKEALKYV